jgi:glutathione S-transferase
VRHGQAFRPARRLADWHVEMTIEPGPGNANPDWAAVVSQIDLQMMHHLPPLPMPSNSADDHSDSRMCGGPGRRGSAQGRGMKMGNTHRALASLLPSLVRLGRGAVVKGHRTRPEKLLELYDGEYCPFCRHVRETLTELDLDAIIYPVPKKSKRFRESLVQLSGKATIPYLHDPNTGKRLHGSATIARYLYAEYGPEGKAPRSRLLNTSVVATALRGTNGMFAKPSTAPDELLELYSFEASPYARLVRETLCELEIPYVLHNVGKSPGSMVEWLPPGLRLRMKKDYVPQTENRRKLQERGGRMQVPYLVDLNTNVAMYESADIQRYLRETYGASAADRSAAPVGG